MKVIAILFLTTVLVFSSHPPGISQTRFFTKEADKAWPEFLTKFRSAVRARDRITLRSMLAPDLLFSLGHHKSDHLDDAFKFRDADNGRGWNSFNRILNQGTAPMAPWWNNGRKPSRPSRVSPAAANLRVNIDRQRIDWYAIFEYREDGRWYCDVFQQCCD